VKGGFNSRRSGRVRHMCSQQLLQSNGCHGPKAGILRRAPILNSDQWSLALERNLRFY